MYTLTTTDTLTFVLEGFEQALAFRAKVKVAKEDILSITWYEKFDQWPDMLIRMPGSFLPAWIMAGSYWNEEGWDFVFAKKPKGLLLPLLFDVLVLETSQQKYKRIIVNIPKKKSQEIISWWKEK
jgi:hypothetical protein